MELLTSRYEVLATLGAGRSSSSAVLRARDLQHDRLVALKVYPLPNGLSRADLLREAATLLRLEPHPALPIVRDDFFLPDRYVIVMDWVEGTDLARVLEERGAPGLTHSSVLSYVSQAASALDHLHAHNPPVVHGDVKPSNLILSETGKIVLVDFGIARAVGDRATAGTHGFMAPELAAGGPVTPAADVYGLAATAVALLTGHPPLGGAPAWEGIDPEHVGTLARALRQALATKPASRPASAGEFAERLRGSRALPAGVVTLLAIELHEASSLWERDARAMRAAAGRLDDLIAGCVEEHGGRTVRSMGEGERLVAVFASATAAAAASLALHAGIANEQWPGRMDIRVRVGLHSGEAELRDGIYVGPAVVRVARMRSLAAPASTAVSVATADLIRDGLPAGAQLVELEAPRSGSSREQFFALVQAGTLPLAATSRPVEGLLSDVPRTGRAEAEFGSKGAGGSALAQTKERGRLANERAAQLLANRRVVEIRIERALREREATEASARQALTLSASEQRSGNHEQAGKLNTAAERLAHRLVELDHEIDSLQAQLEAAPELAGRTQRTLEVEASTLGAHNRSLAARVAEQERAIERLSELQHFLSPQIAEAIKSRPEALEPHREEITVCFCDLRGFTAFSESAEPEDLMQVVREYHTAMGELIFQFEGTLEHFEGDGMMVFFNDPLPCDDPPGQAVQMAIAMRTRAAELTTMWQRRGHRLGFAMGIATGFATLGRIGFEGRFDYGAIGSVTNIANRLCAEAGPNQILVTDRICAGLDDRVSRELVGDLTLKGLSHPVTAFNIRLPSA